MGVCWSSTTVLQIPVPPSNEEEPPPGYEYIPLESYIMAIELEPNHQNLYTNSGGQIFKNPWNESIFT